MIVFRANDREVGVMQKILSDYEKASGKAINLSKSEIFFSRNVDDELKHILSSSSEMQACLGTGKYWGSLP